jgi:hypothetical protein
MVDQTAVYQVYFEECSDLVTNAMEKEAPHKLLEPTSMADV